MFKMSHGNKKLVPNDDVKFLIWSLPPVETCPFRTGLCERFCYAKKAWKQYPNVRAAWTRNYNATHAETFVSEMIDTIEHELNRPSVKAAKQLVVRIHESGDFYSKEYAEKWLKIASHFENIPKVKFMAYTKSVVFFHGERIPKNMTVRFSLWADTDAIQSNMADCLGLPIYTAVETFTTETKKERCECVDCGTCRKCWSGAIELLKCEIH